MKSFFYEEFIMLINIFKNFRNFNLILMIHRFLESCFYVYDKLNWTINKFL